MNNNKSHSPKYFSNKATLFAVSVCLFSLSNVYYLWLIIVSKSAYTIAQFLLVILILVGLFSKKTVKLIKYNDTLSISLCCFLAYLTISTVYHFDKNVIGDYRQIVKLLSFSMLVSLYLVNRKTHIDLNSIFLSFGVVIGLCSITALTDTKSSYV